MFQRLILSLLLLWSASALAKERSDINGYLGFGPGGLGFGVDYQMKWDRHSAWGVYAHSYSVNNDGNGALALGVFSRPFIRKGPYLFRLTVGGGMLNVTPSVGNTRSTFGPILGIGFTKKITKTVSLGFEAYHYYGWFGKPNGKAFEAGMLAFSYRL